MAGGVGMNAAKYVLAGGLAVVGPHKPAVVNGGESTSYGDLAVRVSRFAGALREAGMKPGDRAALFMLDHDGPGAMIFGTSLLLSGLSPSSPRATSRPR